MRKNIAICGLDCETCEAYLATLNDDQALREKTADSEKTQQRVDELEKELNATQRQLSDASARLARLFK